MAKNYVLALDAGTTSNRAIVFDSLAEGKYWKYERLNCMK